MVFALLYGATFWITAPLTVLFVRNRFGNHNLGTLTGGVTMIHHAGGGIGALLGALVFDWYGGYELILAAMIIVSVFALWLCPRAGPEELRA